MQATTNDNPKHINYWLLTPLLATHTHSHTDTQGERNGQLCLLEEKG